MEEKENQQKKYFRDPEALNREMTIVREGRRIFSGSALVKPHQQITEEDLDLIRQFHRDVAPTNPKNPWRLEPEQQELTGDSSFFKNWESPGGPLEHIDLTVRAAVILVREIKDHLKSEENVAEDWAKNAILNGREIDLLHAAAGAALHDEGREVTHLFYTNDLIGSAILKRIGIRSDILDVGVDEKVMVTPADEDMDVVMQGLLPEAVIVRIADEYGKRKPGLNRIMQPEDFNPKQQEEWAKKYRRKEEDKGKQTRPSQEWWKDHVDLHDVNAQRYLEALDKYVRGISDLTLKDLARTLHRELSPTLPKLPVSREKVPLLSTDVQNGKVFSREIKAGQKSIELEAVTHIGAPKKKFNEDGLSVITGGSCAQFYVVDGGTQVRPVATLKDISGGKYVAEKSVEFSKLLNPKNDLRTNLKELNDEIMRDVAIDHEDIIYGENTENVPYGSIAAVKIDPDKDLLEVANAGDAFVVVVDKKGKSRLVTVDDVYVHDQKTFAVARELAKFHGVTVRYAMEHRDLDERFYGITEQMLKHMKILNAGGERRILGGNAPNFDMTHVETLSLEDAKEILIFSDGAVPAGIDIHGEEGLSKFVRLVNEVGLEGLYSEIEEAAAADPDFEKSPRFRNIDDMTILSIKVGD